MTEQQLFQYSKFFKAIANPTRLKILRLLDSGEMCVCDIESQLDLDMSVISRHLKLLHDNQIVSSDRQGKKVFYKLEMRCIFSFITCIDAGLKREA
jgi:ArsR family transcriptional regulator